MWANESVFYQIYPMGFCGSPRENDGVLTSRILKVIDWIPHIRQIGCDAIYFSPIFESDSHGYNTRDYRKIDCRLGSNEDFKKVCDALHQNGIRVVIDGVFNHVGRGFFAFEDVLKNRWESEYKDWFFINFDGNNGYNDGLWYEGWEGHYDLVKLNLKNPQVVEYLLGSVHSWIEKFDIDGIRLDVAYCLDYDFMKTLRSFCDKEKNDFFLVGEMVHGDYKRLVADDVLHSVTNYECYKGLYSSFNSMNMFEINHSLLRQFGEDGQGIYKGMHLLSFVDNHDVSRVSSILNNERHLPLIYTLLFGMPGIPCIYYGSEWGVKGDKKDGDWNLRPCFEAPEENELTKYIAVLSSIYKEEKAMALGSFRNAFLTNNQCIIVREYEGERIFIAINAQETEFYANFGWVHGKMIDLITKEVQQVDGTVHMNGYQALILKELKES